MSKLYDKLYSHFRRHLKNLLRNYFVWEGLPDTIDARALEETLLFEEGFIVGFQWNEASDRNAEYKDKVIVSGGALAGIDLYQRATTFRSANPVIIPPVARTPRVDCVPLFNTKNYRFGENCNTVVNIYADMLADTTISMKNSIRNSRVTILPTVNDDKEAVRVNDLMKQIYDGEAFALRYKVNDFDGQTLFPIRAKDNIVVSELADARRCIMADFFSETGVKTIAVDKRERVNLQEMSSNDTQTKIACDIMLQPRQKWAEEMNAMFGTNISVKFNEEVVKNEGLAETDFNNGATA